MSNPVLALVALLYPLAIAFGQRWVAPRWLAAGLLALAIARLAVGPRDRFAWAWGLGAVLLAATGWFSNHSLPLKLYPILVNAAFLAMFGWSLAFPPTVVERIARVSDPAFPDAAIPYVRRVTQVWCVFFVLNGTASAATAVWASDVLWALYNGCLAYMATGLVFAVEWVVRQRVRRRLARG